jgi:hypothetical protein
LVARNAVGDPHTTPHFDPETGRNRSSTIAIGERFGLAEWVDHMISTASARARCSPRRARATDGEHSPRQESGRGETA